MLHFMRGLLMIFHSDTCGTRGQRGKLYNRPKYSSTHYTLRTVLSNGCTDRVIEERFKARRRGNRFFFFFYTYCAKEIVQLLNNPELVSRELLECFPQSDQS